MQLRKIIKTRGHFPTDEAASKLLWLAIRNVRASRTLGVHSRLTHKISTRPAWSRLGRARRCRTRLLPTPYSYSQLGTGS